MRIALGMFLLDVFCLGVKNASGTNPVQKRSTRSASTIGGGLRSSSPMPPACLRKLVEGGVAYARELGFNPHPDYAVASQIFGELDARPAPPSSPTGRKASPSIVPGPNETAAQAQAIVERLARRLGTEGFDYLVTMVAPPGESV